MEENIISIEEPKKEEKKNNKKKIVLFVFIILLVLIGVGVAVYFLVIKDNKQTNNEETTTTTTRRIVEGIPNTLEEFEKMNVETKESINVINDPYKYLDVYKAECKKGEVTKATVDGHEVTASCNESCFTGEDGGSEEGCEMKFEVEGFKIGYTQDGCTGAAFYYGNNVMIEWNGACYPGGWGITLRSKEFERIFGYGINYDESTHEMIKTYDSSENDKWIYKPFIKDNKLFMVLATPTPNNGHENDAPAKCRIVGVKLDDPYFNMDSSDYFDCTIEYGMS